MIYLDHAATSFPKPPGVSESVLRWLNEIGVSADRGSSSVCAAVASRVADVRHRLARMCGTPADRLVFTSGATDSLNMFFDGFLEEGDAVLTTALEHSSLVRPLTHRRDSGRNEITIVPPDEQGRIDPTSVTDALAKRDYRLFAFSHASNVLGTVVDASRLCATARERNCATLLDASATAGLLDLDVGADAVAASGHKSLLAPPGVGFLAVRPGLKLRPTRFGGTGSSLAMDRQPESWPSAMEPGTPNTPAILALGPALDFIAARGREAILAAELELVQSLILELADRAEIYGAVDGPRIPVVSFNLPGWDPSEVGAILDEANVHVRTGFHCAPWLHDHLGTADGGTVRVSVGPFNSAGDIQALTRALPGG